MVSPLLLPVPLPLMPLPTPLPLPASPAPLPASLPAATPIRPSAATVARMGERRFMAAVILADAKRTLGAL